MSSENSKHVQTELTEDEYELFRAFASESGLSLKEAGREALLEWVDRQQRADPDDPAFTVLETLAAEDRRGSTTDAREASDLVEEWHGDESDLSLADDPSTRS